MLGFLSPLNESATTRLILRRAAIPGPKAAPGNDAVRQPIRTPLKPEEAIPRLRAWGLQFGAGSTRHYLLRADELVSGRTPAGPFTTDARLWDRVERAIRAGKLIVDEEVHDLPAPKNVPTPEAPPPPADPPKKQLDWVEIVLLDEEGVPVAEEKYSIKLPDGSTREGKTDAQGMAREEQFEAGTCFVSFPEIKVRPRAGDSA